MEKLHRGQGFNVRFGEAAGELGTLGLGRKAYAFLLPLDILGWPPGHQLAEEEINNPWTHGLHEPRSTGLTRGNSG